MNEAPLWACLIALTFGIVLHSITKLAELEKQGITLDLRAYWMKNKWTAMSVVLSAYVLFLVQWHLGEGGIISALVTGFACNSAGDKLRARAEVQK